MGFCPEWEPGIEEEMDLDSNSIRSLVPGKQFDNAEDLSRDQEVANQSLEKAIAYPRQWTLDLYGEFRPQLLRYLRRLHLQRDQAEEVIQETFLRLATELADGQQIENKGGWIIRVARNLAIDLLRKKQTEDSHMEELGSVNPENFVDPNAGPFELLWKKERAKQVNAALATLNPQQRQCFELRVQGFLLKDIAHALGVSEQRVAAVVRKVASQLALVCR